MLHKTLYFAGAAQYYKFYEFKRKVRQSFKPIDINKR